MKKNLQSEILKAFKSHINKDDLEQILTNIPETGSQEITGFIMQFDKNKTTIDEFNEILKKINYLNFIVAGIIGSFVFAYSINREELDFNNDLYELVKDKKIITFKVNANIQYCGIIDIDKNNPYFFLPNDIFDSFNKIDFGNIYNFGTINA